MTRPARPVTQTATRVVTQADIDAFARLSGDDNPIHVDPATAAASRFGATVAHGMLLATFLDEVRPRAVGWPWRGVALEFPAPTPAGTEVTATVAASGATAELRVTATDDGRTVCKGVAARAPLALPEGVLDVPTGEGTLSDPWASLLGRYATVTWTVTPEDLVEYRRLAGVPGAHASGQVPLPLIAAAFSRLLGTRLPGPGTMYLKQSVALTRSVPPGVPLTAEVEVCRLRPGKGLVDLATRCRTVDGEGVAHGRALVLVDDVAFRSHVGRLRGEGS